MKAELPQEVPLLVIETAQPHELAAAFRLTLSYLDDDERSPRVASAQSLVSLGELDPDGVFVVRDDAGLRGAMVCVPLPGAGGLVWPPFVQEMPERQLAENQLVRKGCGWLRGRGARLAQALLTERELPLAGPLERNGFKNITQLAYLQHSLQQIPAIAERGQHCRPYDRVEPRLFHDTLLRTYEGSLDCPEVNGLRSVEEIISGHQGQGEFDPRRWWLVSADERPIGVVLLTDVPELEAWDLSYLGIVPEARRQGWGTTLTQLALKSAAAAEVQRLIVAVDKRNTPALNLYQRLNFEVYDERAVYLVIFDPAGK